MQEQQTIVVVVTETDKTAKTYTIKVTRTVSVDAVFTNDATVASGATVTLAVPAGMTAWFAPTGKTVANLSESTTMTTAAGGAASILAPAEGGTYKFYLIDAANILAEGTKTLTVTTAEGYFTFDGTTITAYNIDGGRNVVIPGTVTSIGELAFFGCSGLTEITIPAA